MNSPSLDGFGLLLHDAARLLRRRFEARGGEYGLSSAQWRLLVKLVREGRAAQSRLAELLEIEPISVSLLLDRMEQGGWVERQPDPADRRIRIVVPTDKAIEAFQAVKAVAADVYDEAMEGLSPGERASLMHALGVVVQNLSRDAAGAAKS